MFNIRNTIQLCIGLIPTFRPSLACGDNLGRLLSAVCAFWRANTKHPKVWTCVILWPTFVDQTIQLFRLYPPPDWEWYCGGAPHCSWHMATVKNAQSLAIAPLLEEVYPFASNGPFCDDTLKVSIYPTERQLLVIEIHACWNELSKNWPL